MFYHVEVFGHGTSVRTVSRERVRTSGRIGSLRGTSCGAGKWGDVRKLPNKTVAGKLGSALGESETGL